MTEMKIGRRALLTAAAMMPFWSYAQDFPAGTITIVVASAPGGIIDVIARVLGSAISENLGTTVVVENRPGGNGHIGGMYVARSKPDGHTLLSTSGATLTSGVVQNLQYDPVNDLVPVARVLVTPLFLVVNAKSPYKTVAELVQASKNTPGGLFFGSTNAGNSTHIGAEMLNVMTGMGATHVAYKGSAPALQDLVGGRLHFMFDTRPSIMPLVRDGRLRILAVSSSERQKDLPDVPTMSETVPGFELEGWGGLFAPAATSPAILERLADAQLSAIKSREFADKLSLVGEIRYLPPGPSREYMLEDHKRVSAVVKAAGIRAD